MMAQRNSFINGIGLTDANSLIHLLNNDDTDDDNQLHLVKLEIANKFNTYFINIGHSLSEQIHATRSSDEYLNNRTNTVFNFTEVSEECIASIIKNMKSKSSTSYHNISNKLIKSAKDVLIKPLTLLMNQIIHTDEFPKQLKIAKVKPLFKKGNQSSFTNYRPISLLPSISKIFEHVMTSQLMEYLKVWCHVLYLSDK